MEESKEVEELDEKQPVKCELNLLTESRVFLRGPSNIPRIINCGKENVIE
jgi:hypothetical protein